MPGILAINLESSCADCEEYSKQRPKQPFILPAFVFAFTEAVMTTKCYSGQATGNLPSCMVTHFARKSICAVLHISHLLIALTLISNRL